MMFWGFWNLLAGALVVCEEQDAVDDVCGFSYGPGSEEQGTAAEVEVGDDDGTGEGGMGKIMGAEGRTGNVRRYILYCIIYIYICPLKMDMVFLRTFFGGGGRGMEDVTPLKELEAREGVRGQRESGEKRGAFWAAM